MIDVAIVGGGPVGLYLGCLLLQHGVSVRVLEQRHQRSRHSRAIGIHPPALEALDLVACADPLIRQGIAIHRGLAISGGRRLASMDFSVLDSKYPFVLSSPQALTEAVLENRLLTLDGGALSRGARVTGCADHDSRVEVAFTVTDADGGRDVQEQTQEQPREQRQEERLEARWCVVANGARTALFPGTSPQGGTSQQGSGPARRRSRTYRDAYVMGDFADATGFGSTAVLFLERDGIVESFPLPGGVRRWVARVDQHQPERTPDWLAGVVGSRTGTAPDPGSCTMLSSFSVRSGILPRLAVGRTVAIGDAAHEVSPIGGQGMNLGWLDAVELAPLLLRALHGSPVEAAMERFDRLRRRAARRAAFQSEINMMLGRPAPAPMLTVRNRLLGTLAGIPAVNAFAARRFTMQ
ncbi:NAD(P)/FAD-dependent oxidoreductase [Pseudarthrobacter sp. J75]|uniref:FAD-dependent oxidoreductase n=1 Tax=unclassified Pseudarthrobacter TaxID=2647000 RepID=UPI002E81491B|nr:MULTISPECIES: NAD(P)/FAD-dependent oxidoreductase [unclassified Pseudarthrobacter]MEE2523131.1 NAD(P)/FAD-dependent oxidoreductase [Pseudarthrobacter sp. J47]MEE2529815.1 NAD(P)/FAD-dependent oxidoreductase [Pseudarthrobacter sp. J75]